jgi:hypothetical protein
VLTGKTIESCGYWIPDASDHQDQTSYSLLRQISKSVRSDAF